MTDNRTTELRISEPLRGFIKHQSNRAYIDGGQAKWLTEIADKIDARHEQAIAATLGSGTCAFAKPTDLTDGCAALERIAELEEKLANGTLTAEQVRDAVKRCATFDYGEIGEYVSRENWQAIADELNARAERTCEIESSFLNDFSSEHECWWEFDLSCGHHVTGDTMDSPNYCEVCGAKVVGK